MDARRPERASGTLSVPSRDGSVRVRWSARDLAGNEAEGELNWRVQMPEAPDPTPGTPSADWGAFPSGLRSSYAIVGAESVLDGGARYPQRIRHRASGYELVYVAADSFVLGCDEAAPGASCPTCGPSQLSGVFSHTISLTRGFYVGRTEVSLQHYDGTSSDLPVRAITWQAARAWCGERGLELPTEQQWELAASGRDNRHFPWGNGDDTRKRRANATEPVGVESYSSGPADGASLSCGALNMAGNVAEWCLDGFETTHGSAAGPPPVGARSTGAAQHVVRGGHFMSSQAEQLSTCRRASLAGSSPRTGFRAVLNLQ